MQVHLSYGFCLRRKYGAPISRRRIFLFMVREDVLRDEVKEADFTRYISSKLDDMKVEPKIGWLLISSSHSDIVIMFLFYIHFSMNDSFVT